MLRSFELTHGPEVREGQAQHKEQDVAGINLGHGPKFFLPDFVIFIYISTAYSGLLGRRLVIILWLDLEYA